LLSRRRFPRLDAQKLAALTRRRQFTRNPRASVPGLTSEVLSIRTRAIAPK